MIGAAGDNCHAQVHGEFGNYGMRRGGRLPLGETPREYL